MSIKAVKYIYLLNSYQGNMFSEILKNKHLKDFLNESAIHGLRLLLYYTPFKYARY